MRVLGQERLLLQESLLDNELVAKAGESPRARSGDEVAKYYAAVPWLFFGTDLRASAIASLPFDIARNDSRSEVVDSSDDYQNEVGFLPDPEELLWLIEASLTLTGSAYLFRERNRIRTLGLYYKEPHTITPVIDEDAGLIGFERKIGAYTLKLSTDDIVYFWHPDPSVEIGPPTAWPALAAQAASGVLFNLDEFVSAFFARGAIKTSVVALEQPSADKEERNRFKAAWSNAMQGLKNAWDSLIVNAKAMTIIPVGEGVKDLQNTELTGQARESIAAALKIPYTLLFSGSAAGLGGGGVTESDTLRFLKQFVVPRSRWIARRLNEQVFEPMGYRLRFKPETLDELQEDETQRAASLQTFNSVVRDCSSWEQFEFVTKVMGYEWDDEAERLAHKYFAKKEEQRVALPAPGNSTITATNEQGGDKDEETNDEARQAAKALERKQFKAAVRKNPNKAHTFEFKWLDADEQAALRQEAQGGETALPFQGVEIYRTNLQQIRARAYAASDASLD